ncbi:MAG: CRTAC1 family protein [Pseudomonadota bacterium]
MRKITLAFVCAATAAHGQSFADRTGDQPFAHSYVGGWEHFVGGGVAVLDCNVDGFPDLFAAGGENPTSLLVNRTSGPGSPIRFERADGPALTGVTGAYPLDMDSDGIEDLAVLRVGPNVALRGLGDCQFEDATAAWGIDPGSSWTTAFSATWEEGAAWPTLVFGNYVDREDPEGPFGTCDTHDLFRPTAEGYGPPTRLDPGYCTLSMLFSDWDRAGRAALRVSNDRHYYLRGGEEQMWEMAPELRLLGAADGWQSHALWGMGIASRDISGDGFPEVMLTSMGDQKLQRRVPEKGRAAFETVPFATGAAAQRPYMGDDGRPSTGWHAEFGDVNNDGLPDLFLSKGNVDQMPDAAMFDPNNLLMLDEEGRFHERGETAGITSMHRGRGAAVEDLNQDGLNDIVVVNRRAPLEIFENVTEVAGNWISVALRQPAPNVFAVGAWVEVRWGDRQAAQEVTVGGGHAGGSSGPLHFGLGSADVAEARVIWPGGQTGAWVPLAANTHHVIARETIATE